MSKIIYIHHNFYKSLFYKIGHNTTEKVFNINENTKTGYVTGKYKGNDIKFIFDPSINDNQDGLHLIDFTTAYLNKNNDPTYKDVKVFGHVKDVPFLEKFNELLKDRKNWIVTFFRSEKILAKYDVPGDIYVNQIEDNLNMLSNHKIICDNFFIKDGISDYYPHIFSALTNTVWQWNELINIRYYYEFKQVYEKLNFDYDLIYSVRNHKRHRIDILKGLSEYNNPKVLVQRTDSMNNDFYKIHDEELLKYTNIKINKLEGTTDFSNLKSVEYHFGINHDLFFRFLGKAKMQVLDESWAWSKQDFYVQYFSEKTIGLVLSNIPFISTHPYPIIMLQNLLNLPTHPFLKDFDLLKGDAVLFVEFVKKFMENFDDNFVLCKDWTELAHNKLMEKMDSENSLLDMIFNNFELPKKINKIEKTLL